MALFFVGDSCFIAVTEEYFERLTEPIVSPAREVFIENYLNQPCWLGAHFKDMLCSLEYLQFESFDVHLDQQRHVVEAPIQEVIERRHSDERIGIRICSGPPPTSEAQTPDP